MRGSLDDDDGIVDHNADRQHDREQSGEIHPETKRPHGCECADDGDRNGGRRHQHRAPILQKDQDHDQHQNRRADERLVDLLNRCIDEHGGVIRRRVNNALREFTREGLHFCLDRALDLERVRARGLKNAHGRTRLPIERKRLAVGLRAKLDAADVADPRDGAGIAGLHDHVRELADIGEPALHIDGVMEVHTRRRRRRADLARCHVLALLLQGLNHVLGVEAARLELVRIEPDAHRVLAGAELFDFADAGQTRQLIHQIDGGVVGQIEAVAAFVGRGQDHEQKRRGRTFFDRHALRLDRLRQRRQRACHPILHQDLRGIEIGADPESDGQRIGAVAGVGRLHVEHVLDAVDLLFDRQRHGFHQRARAGAGVAGRHLHGRGHDVGILRDRQSVKCDSAEQDHQDSDDVRQYRMLDEEFRDHVATIEAVRIN